MASDPAERGRLVSAALAGAWRQDAPPLDLPAGDFAEAVPLLMRTGAGALGWWRVRHSELRACPPAGALLHAFLVTVQQCEPRESQIEHAVTALRSAGVEPLLAKGWALARLYPENGLRPVGDIDLFVRPEQFADARAALAAPDLRGYPIDLHSGVPELQGERTARQVHERSRVIGVGRTDVRTLGPEDTLRHLCLHFLKHGAWRPGWLCDIGVVLESVPGDFDWDYCLAGDRRRSDWVACTLGLAHRLLGARLGDGPARRRANRLPRWLIPAVLRQWGSPYLVDPRLLVSYLRHPAGLLRALRGRWRNPVEATVNVHGPFNEVPRFPFQLADCCCRAAGLAARLAGLSRKAGRAGPF